MQFYAEMQFHVEKISLCKFIFFDLCKSREQKYIPLKWKKKTAKASHTSDFRERVQQARRVAWRLEFLARKQFVFKWQSEKRQTVEKWIVNKKKSVETSHNYWRKIDN